MRVAPSRPRRREWDQRSTNQFTPPRIVRKCATCPGHRLFGQQGRSVSQVKVNVPSAKGRDWRRNAERSVRGAISHRRAVTRPRRGHEFSITAIKLSPGDWEGSMTGVGG